MSDDVIFLHAPYAYQTQKLLQKFKWESLRHHYTTQIWHTLIIIIFFLKLKEHLCGTRFSLDSDMKTASEIWVGTWFVPSHINQVGHFQINGLVDLMIMWKNYLQICVLILFCIFYLLLINHFLFTLQSLLLSLPEYIR